MPKLVGLPIDPSVIVSRHDVSILVEIGNIKDFRVAYALADDAYLALGFDRGGVLQRPITARKCNLPLVVEPLLRQHADGVFVHGMLDRLLHLQIDVATEIDSS